MILADISVLLILAESKFGNIAIQLKCYLCMLTGPEKIVRRIVFLSSFFFKKIQDGQ